MTTESSLIVLRGLEGSAPTQLSGLQLVLASHIVELKMLWWVVFFGTLAFVALRHVVLPLFKR